jgi:hypothetical protein
MVQVLDHCTDISYNQAAGIGSIVPCYTIIIIINIIIITITLYVLQTVQVLDHCTDISYNVAAGIGSIVSSRDFVNLRHWGEKDGIYVSAGNGVTHPDKPPVKKHIRCAEEVWIFVFMFVEKIEVCFYIAHIAIFTAL